jgi:hypothetical protein
MLNIPIKICLPSTEGNFRFTFDLGKPPSSDIFYALPVSDEHSTTLGTRYCHYVFDIVKMSISGQDR